MSINEQDDTTKHNHAAQLKQEGLIQNIRDAYYNYAFSTLR